MIEDANINNSQNSKSPFGRSYARTSSDILTASLHGVEHILDPGFPDCSHLQSALVLSLIRPPAWQYHPLRTRTQYIAIFPAAPDTPRQGDISSVSAPLDPGSSPHLDKRSYRPAADRTWRYYPTASLNNGNLYRIETPASRWPWAAWGRLR